MDIQTTKEDQEGETTYYTGILYHGAKREVNFDPKFNYNDGVLMNDGSFTLGEGLYFTNSEEVASDYSNVRGGGRGHSV